ncbi:Cytochrome P450 4F12 [Trichoplax sp. H2]|nr:Cytochrome P450 4F12 [Trichoplax sp. H2]|eukprot:RDD44411.1 Cytochrome P450 4F12 [Trichoplax sp. H2]
MTLNDNSSSFTYVIKVGFKVSLATYAVYVAYKCFIKPYFSPLKQMPGPAFRPVIGNLYDLYSSRPMEIEIKWTEKYGKFVHFHNVFNEDIVMISCPKAINHVLIVNHKNYEKQKAFQVNQRLIGDGVMASTGRDHAKYRGMIAPAAFNADSITVMTTVFNMYATSLCQLWRHNLSQSNDGIICVQKYFKQLTLDIMGRCTFGYEFEALSGCNIDAKNISAVFNRAVTGQLFGLVQFIPYFQYLPLACNREIEAGLSVVRKAIDSTIALKRNSRQRSTSDVDLLDILMDIKDETGKPAFTDKQLRDNILTFMMAGRETATAALSWTLYLLAKHPKIQDKARTEIQNVLRQDRDLANSDLDQLKYIEFIIMETLRLYPPVDVLRRVAKKDDVIQNYKIPAGTLIYIALAVCQRCDDAFPNGNEFNPERFKREDVRDHGVLSFSIGSRTCMGKRFAMTEMKITLAKLLFNFKFSLPSANQRIEPRRCGMFILPNPLIQLKVEPILI